MNSTHSAIKHVAQAMFIVAKTPRVVVHANGVMHTATLSTIDEIQKATMGLSTLQAVEFGTQMLSRGIELQHLASALDSSAVPLAQRLGLIPNRMTLLEKVIFKHVDPAQVLDTSRMGYRLAAQLLESCINFSALAKELSFTNALLVDEEFATSLLYGVIPTFIFGDAVSLLAQTKEPA